MKTKKREIRDIDRKRGYKIHDFDDINKKWIYEILDPIQCLDWYLEVDGNEDIKSLQDYNFALESWKMIKEKIKNA